MVNCENNVITITSLSEPDNVQLFHLYANRIVEKGYKVIELKTHNINGIYANTIVPITAAIEFHRNRGIKVNLDTGETPSYLEHTHFGQPLIASDENISSQSNLNHKIWCFDDDSQNHLLDKLIDLVSYNVECEDGVIAAFTWSLCELMDNIPSHSNVSNGFIMVQIHPHVKRLHICIADYGIGIYNTLKDSEYSPLTPIEAIELSIQKGVTSKKNTNQGYGLYGFYSLINANQGRMNIISGPASLSFKDNKINKKTSLHPLHSESYGTIIDFQLNTNVILNFPNVIGQTANDLDLEEMEVDTGEHVLMIHKHPFGTGSRSSGDKIRKHTNNILTRIENKIEINFSNVQMISSSFADEFIGKLFMDMGLEYFKKRIKITGVNKNVKSILLNAMSNRLNNKQ